MQIERPAKCRVGLAELVDERTVVRAEASLGLQLCVEDDHSSVYKGAEPTASIATEADAKTRKLSSSVMRIRKVKKKTAKRSEGGKEGGIREAKT